MKKTKIICSIGPASCTTDIIEKMMMAGMDVARINFTHANTIQERDDAIISIKNARHRTHRNVAILWDTRGPEFRTGAMKEDITLVAGEKIRIVKEEVLGNAKRISVNHKEALDAFQIGNIVLLENAKMKLEVISKEEDGITCQIIEGGILGSHKSISVPGIHLNLPYLSDVDRRDIQYACCHEGEFLAISFVSCKEDVLEVKEILKEYHREDLQIICKIESNLGIENLESILEVSDGIMVARGDLGTEVASERLPLIQKEMIKTCRKMGKICIVATEMLETMMENNRPKRAETSDIANAVLDGVDALMLSGETTIGKHPVEAVSAMARICEATEAYANFHYIEQKEKITSIPKAIAESVVESANRLDAKIICAATMSGKTAKLISNLKPSSLILGLCPNEKVGRSLALHWGVYPMVIPICKLTDEVLIESVAAAKRFMPLQKDDYLVITGSFPNIGKSRPTNLMKIEKIEE